ncbi:hypothetical protein [Endozoicomonas sp. 2B-B]
MTNARPNALRLAVAVAICSSILGTQAVTDRKLQTKSIDIRCSGQVEFTQSEVIVQPTLGDDQQPVPNSFTTTYPDQTVKKSSFAHTRGFTNALAGVDGGVSSVELFETGEKDVAVKYTKVLKVADEGVFRFTHNLEEKELVIEIRGGMTDQDSVAAVRDQLVGIQSLEPLTKVASPRQLAGVLKAASNRAGNLGTSDHYVALATIETEKVEVNGRTFMSLIASSEQPPELQRLGQSLFVNDEALLAAATSAYIQVHILGQDVQQQALNELLAYSKPVGYVVNVEDDKQVYPVPAGYPILKVKEAPGEIIVFYGQMQNPHDIAFVESLHKRWLEIKSPAPALTTQVKKDNFKSYLYIIRSRQMELLEKFIARLDSGVNTDQPTTISIEDKMSTFALLYYESLQQALNTVITNRAHGTDEVEFTLKHIRIVSSVITPTWMHNQLVKNFGFQPVFRNLLINAQFMQNIHNVIPTISNINQAQIDTSEGNEKFASKVMSDMMTRQLLEFYNNLAKLRAKEAKLGELNEKLLRANEQVKETMAIAVHSGQEKLREKHRFDDRLELLRIRLKHLENQNQIIRREVSQVIWLKQEADVAKTEGEEARVNIKEFYELLQAVVTSSGTREESNIDVVKAKLTTIEDQLGITPVNENDLFERFKSIQKHLQEKAESYAVLDQHRAEQISQDPVNEADLEAPDQAIQQHPAEEEAQVAQQHFQQRSFRTDTTREAEIKSQHATIAARLHIQDFDKDADVFVQHESLIQKIKTMNDEKARLRQQLETMNAEQEQPPQRVQRSSDHRNIYNSGDEDVLVATLGVELNDNTTAEELDAMERALNMTLYELTRLKKIMDRTLAPKTRPEILSLLKKVERVLEDDRLNDEDDVYLHRQIISEGIQKYIIAARERLEENALKVLEASEKLFNIDSNEGDDKAARLERIHKRLDGDDISAYDLDEMDKILWGNYGTTRDDQRGRDFRLKSIHPRLRSLVEVSEERVNELQSSYLANVEWELEIDPRRSVAAIEKSKAFTTKLANDLQVEFEKDISLSEKQQILKTVAWELLAVVRGSYEDESIKRELNNEIARRFNIEGYQNDATIDEQVRLLIDKLIRVGSEIYKAGQLDVSGRIQAIEDELDRQMAPLGPKPRYALDRELATARRALQEAESEQEAARQKLLGLATGDEQTLSERVNDIEHFLQGLSAERQDEVLERATKVLNIQITGEHGLLEEAEYFTANKAYTNIHGQEEPHAFEGELPLTRKKYNQLTKKAADLKPEPTDTHEQRVDALRNKQVQPGGHDDTGGKIQQLLQERTRLEGEIETREAGIERMKLVLDAAEQAVKNDGGPFQYTPRQAIVREEMDAFVQQHSLKKQALEVTLGLAELAVESGNTISCLPGLDFDDEFASIRMQAMVGDTLTFKQASLVAEVFKRLRKTFPEPPFEPPEGLPRSNLKKILRLVHKARNEMKKGALQYDDEIRSMGKTAIHFVEHESGDLKSFPEYFASRSASGNKIIALLREDLVSKIELENYIKVFRDVDGYQTVDQFEHFLGYKHGVNVPHFKAVVRMLSDKGVEEFIQRAFAPVSVTATGPTAMKESIVGMKEYGAAVIANFVLDDIAFDNGHRTAAFLTNVQDTLTPYTVAAGLSESELIRAIHGTLMQAHAAVVEYQLNAYWVKPSAFLAQAVTWYFSSYKPLLTAHTAAQAAGLSLTNMSFLYLLDLTNRGDYLHRMLTPFQHWLERFGPDPDRTRQYAYHRGIEKVSEVGGLAMPLGKAASSVILLRTGCMLFARQYNANPQMYRSISRLLPEMVKSMGSGQGIQVPLLHRATPQKVKTLASATAGLVLGPVATAGAYAHGLISGFTYAQSFGFALASGLTFDFFMNDNKLLTQWLGGPLGRNLDKMNRWIGAGEKQDEYLKRTTIATPQGFSENDEDYSSRVKANNTIYGWTRHEHYLQFRERRDRTMKLFENSWEKYFRENVPKWSFSHAESIPYSYTLGAFYK